VGRLRKPPTIFDETLIVSTMVIILSTFHFLEVLMWGAALYGLGAVNTIADAGYFSLTTYTTLGATDVAFDQRFRALAGFESLLGPLMIAWSTALIATVLVRLAELKQQMLKK
jgi:voltage-gated potassium channel Kch